MVKQSIPNFENTRVAFSSKSDASLKKAYLLFTSMHYPKLVQLGTSVISTCFKLHLPIKGLIKHTLFNQFCGGEYILDCEPTIKSLADYNIGTILDYSVEGSKDSKSYENTVNEIQATITQASNDKNIPFAVFKVTGICPVQLLEKIQAGESLSNDEAGQWETVKKRVDDLCKLSHYYGIRIFIDAEETWIQQPIDEIALEMMKKYNKEKAVVYNTYQMYLSAKLGQLEADLQAAKQNGFKLGVKLVRGAYMEKERARAEKMGYPSPVQPNKKSCDNDYNKALEFIISNHENFALCAGTHNEYSSLLLTKLMEKANISTENPDFFFAQLYGMSDHISYNLSNEGYNVAKYVPYGPVKEVMPYLFRRAEENTSIAGQSSRELLLIQKEMQRRKQSK